MKKHTRLLSFLLALSLLFTSVFVTNVFASDGEEKSTPEQAPEAAVGSYTAPAGSWTPEATDIAFAVWNSEEDFLEGKAPVATSVSNEITEALVGGRDSDKKTFYVHLFADCTTLTSGQLYTGRYHTVVINLAGHSLNCPKGIRIGNGSGVFTEAKLTIKNGTFNQTGGQIQTRQQSELRYDNVIYNITGGYAAYDEAAKLIEFKNSVINVKAAGTCMFDLAIVNGEGYTNELRFINTEIVQTVDAVGALIRVSTALASNADRAYKIFFDKDSSIVRPGNMPLVVLNSANHDRTTAFPVFNAHQQLVFEAGFTMSDTVIVDEYFYSYINRSTGATLYPQKTVPTAAPYSVLDFTVVANGEAVDYMTVENEGMITFVKAPSAQTAWTPEKDTTGVDYTGMTYAMWASELDYLLGNPPVKFETSDTMLSKTVGSSNAQGTSYSDTSFIPGFVRLYSDVTNKQTRNQLIIGTTQSLVIDLGGYTLDDQSGFRITGSTSSSLTIKNGTWNLSSKAEIINTGADYSLVFEDLKVNISTSATTQFLDSVSADYVRFTNCDITSANGNVIDLGGSLASVGADRSVLILENTSITYTTAPQGSVFVINESTTADALWDIYLDKDSSIKGVSSLLTLKEAYKNSVHAGFVSNQNVKIENGFLYNDTTVAPTEYLFIDVDSATGTASEAVTVTIGEDGSLVTLEVVEEIVFPGDSTEGPSYPETDPNPDPAPETPVEPDPEPDVPVDPNAKGSYVAPEGVWAPTADYTGITYGVWASEADFLAGKPPVKWSKDSKLDTSLIGTTDNNGSTYADTSFVPGYVHLFSDVTSPASAQFYVGQKQKLIINLAGHKFTDKYAFRVGGTSSATPEAALTIKNGYWIYNSGLIQLRPDSSFTLDNVVFEVHSGQVFYSAQADYITFKNSKVVFKVNSYFCLNTNSKANTPRSTFKFINTELVLEAKLDRLFEATTSQYNKTAWDIYFDQNSSITGQYDNFYVIKDFYFAGDASYPAAVYKVLRQNIYVELGCPNQELLTATAVYYAYSEDGTALPKVTIQPSDTEDSNYATFSVDPNATPDPEPDPDPTPTPTPDPEEPEYSTDKGQFTAPEGAWVPGEDYAGITYATWATEADYLNGEAPRTYSTSKNFDTAVVGVTDSDGTAYADPSYVPGYVHFFDDVDNFTAQVVTGHDQRLIINLAGHTLNDKKGIRVGGSSSSHPKASVTIKNGCWNYMSGQIQLRYDVEFIVENVIFDCQNTQIFYWASADYVIFRDCQIIARKEVHFALSASYPQHNAPRSTLSFENTEIVLTTQVTRLFEIKTSNYGTSAWDIYFDENSSIKGEVKDLLYIKEAFIDSTLYKSPRQNVYFELGFSCTNTNVLNPTAVHYSYDAKGVEIPAKTIKSADTSDSIFYLALVEPDTTNPAKGDIYAVGDGKVISLVTSIEGLDLAYIFTVEGARFQTAKLAVKDADGNVFISCKELQAIAEGAYVTFMTDLVYDYTDSTNADGRIERLQNNIIFDLNGHSFKLTRRFQFEKTFTFKNGTMLITDMTTAPFYGSAPDEDFRFIDVDIVFTAASGASVYNLFEFNAGNLYVTGGSITATGKTVIRLAAGAVHGVYLDGVTVDCHTLVDKNYIAGTDLDVVINNCKIKADRAFYLRGSYAEAVGDKINATIKNSSLEGNLAIAESGITASLITVTVYDTYFATVPTVPENAGSLVIPRGQKLMTVEGAELPIAIKTLAVSIKANLTLESVFGVQFFIPKDTAMTTITIGTTVYNVADLTETVVYDGVEYLVVAVRGINPSDAAEVIDIVIVYSEGDLVNTVVTGYSPLDYVKSVLSSDISYYIKQMLVAATEYIAASYAYVGKTSAELDALRETRNYTVNLTEKAVAEDTNADMSAVKDAFSGASLDLGATMKIRFNIKDGYSGNVTVNGSPFEIVNGKIGEINYIDVQLAAHEMYNAVIEVIVDGNVGTYSLSDYTFNIINDDSMSDSVKTLVAEFYNYTMYANRYYSVVND